MIRKYILCGYKLQTVTKTIDRKVSDDENIRFYKT